MKPELISWFRRAFLGHGPRRYAVMQPETADRKYDDYPGELTDTHIQAHLDGRAAYAVPYTENGLGQLLGFDIDAGGIHAARALLNAASAHDLWAFGQMDTTRGRGYVWIPFDDLVNAERLRLLGDQLITEITQPGWKIENRATNEDTRLPFACHRWTGIYGTLVLPEPQWDKSGRNYAETAENPRFSGVDHIDIDADPTEAFALLIDTYRENPASVLPPAPEPRARNPLSAVASGPGRGVTIASYNAATDLAQLLDYYGARPARGRGARLFFCPFHSDDHASLLLTRDGQRCHCLSQGSECPLSGKQFDAFNVFCIGERLSPQQAIRRLNGLPDDPEQNTGPQRPPAGTQRSGSGSPPASDQQTRAHQPIERPRSSKTGQSAATPAKHLQTTFQTRPEARTEAKDGRRLPKTSRRILDVIAAHPGGYIRGKYHLAQLLDVDPRTVQRSLRRLEAEGLLHRQERGRDGQTDIYRVADPRSGLAPREGRHLPPTLDLETTTNPKPLEADKGGQSPPDAHQETYPEPTTGDDQAERPAAVGLVLPVANGEEITGPAGAFAVIGGAAYVPPEAEYWYAALQNATGVERPEEPAADPEPETVPMQLENAPSDEQPAEQAPAKRRKRRKGATFVQPGQLVGRIIAATKKAEKLERGKASEQRQARAIRRSIGELERKLAALQEEQEATYYSAEEAEQWTPPAEAWPEPSAAPAPSGIAIGEVNWAYLEQLYAMGERRGIEVHCALTGADVAHVLDALAVRTGPLSLTSPLTPSHHPVQV